MLVRYAARLDVARKNQEVAEALAKQLLPREQFLSELDANNELFRQKDVEYLGGKGLRCTI